jgi:Protein of unknown function (DUF3099)
VSQGASRRESSRPEVYRITSATGSHSADMQQRATRYLMSMGIRTVCVILVIFVPGPLRWVFAVGAIVLPYIAVVAANAAGERRGEPLPPPPPRTRPGLTGAPQSAAARQHSTVPGSPVNEGPSGPG